MSGNQTKTTGSWPGGIHFLAGGVAGTIGAAITCPLEVVKTRLQSSLYKQPVLSNKGIVSQTIGHINGVFSILSGIYRNEGVRALWKGLGPNLIGVVPARAIYFGTYSNTKHLYSTWNNGVESSIVHMFSAATSGTIVALVTNPIWLVKTRMQLQSTNSTIDAVRYKNAFHCAYLVIKTEGVRALYKGFSASLIGLSESTLQFVTYEALKSSFNNKKDPSVSSPPNWLELFSAAAVAKLGATLITYPHEVLRTRLRQSPDLSGKIKYTGLAQATKLILKEEGVGAFYGGMTAHIMRVVPNAAILFFSYELILYWYENRMKERE